MRFLSILLCLPLFFSVCTADEFNTNNSTDASNTSYESKNSTLAIENSIAQSHGSDSYLKQLDKEYPYMLVVVGKPKCIKTNEKYQSVDFSIEATFKDYAQRNIHCSTENITFGAIRLECKMPAVDSFSFFYYKTEELCNIGVEVYKGISK